MAVAVEFPERGVGVDRCVVVPSPNCPRLLAPKQLTEPDRVRAHVNWFPPRTSATLSRLVTVVGKSIGLAKVPTPISPWTLSPQHHRPFVVVTAHVWNAAHPTALTLGSKGATSTGRDVSSPEPSPSSPFQFRP